jgi:uncharacterized RDD family membrane protein YckC
MNQAAVAARPRAGFITRLAALITDMLILLGGLRGAASLLLMTERALRRFAPPFSLGHALVYVAPLVTILYNVLFWWQLGQTPGKWLFGIRVVAVGGGKVGLLQAFIRFGGYLVSALPFYLGFLWVLGPERRGFHDRLAGTEVVHTRRPAREAPGPRERPVVPRRYLTA